MSQFGEEESCTGMEAKQCTAVDRVSTGKKYTFTIFRIYFSTVPCHQTPISFIQHAAKLRLCVGELKKM